MIGDLATTLLLIPCSGGKKGWRGPDLPPSSVADFLGPEASRLLKEGRQEAFDHPRTHLTRDAPPQPALHTYSGYPYATPGFRDLLIAHLGRGLHCLIVSGGYGLLRPGEPIQPYEAQLQHTFSVWRRRTPAILRDYVHRHGITRTFGVFSRVYASVVPIDLTASDYRTVEEHDPELEGGVAMQVVPQKVGQALVELLSSDYALDERVVVGRGNAGERPHMPSTPTFPTCGEESLPHAPKGGTAFLGAATAAAVRQFLFESYVQPARSAGQRTTGPIRAGDVHRAMGLSNRQPLVCSVMDSRKFLDEADLELVYRTGPSQSATTTYVYRIR